MSIHAYAKAGDLANLQEALATGVSLEDFDESGWTVLMAAVASTKASVEMVRFLLESGANVNAITTPKDDGGHATVLSIAARSSSLEKIRVLVNAGADVSFLDSNGYSVALNALHRIDTKDREEDFAILEFLIDSGGPLDVASKCGESVLSVASRQGAFATVRFCLDRGANPQPLGWTPLFAAVAFGTSREVAKLVDEGAALNVRDRWGRTPFLLSIHAGQLEIAKLLLSRGSDRSAKGRCGHTALMYAIDGGDPLILKWLINEGWDVEETDDFGEFPLMHAAWNASCLKVLLQAGARVSRQDRLGNGIMERAGSREVVELLTAAGEDITETNSTMRALLTGIERDQEFAALGVSKREYLKNRSRRFGRRNPDRMNNPFWDAMIQSRTSAYGAASTFGEAGSGRQAVWCFDRYGQSFTQLPDGRFVEIGGEHEDYYDPDFCIYNDVVVYHGDGTFDILGYPERDFPPTDFHTATFHAPYLYIIGCLGYVKQRRPGHTPIYRLHCETWKMEKLQSSGKSPGWIYKHKAKRVGDHHIEICGGEVIDGTENGSIKNTNTFVLDLSDFTWQMV